MVAQGAGSRQAPKPWEGGARDGQPRTGATQRRRPMCRPAAGLSPFLAPESQDLACGLRPGLTCCALTGFGTNTPPSQLSDALLPGRKPAAPGKTTARTDDVVYTTNQPLCGGFERPMAAARALPSGATVSRSEAVLGATGFAGEAGAGSAANALACRDARGCPTIHRPSQPGGRHIVAQGVGALRPRALGWQFRKWAAPHRGDTATAAHVPPRCGALALSRAGIPGLGLRPTSWANMLRPDGLRNEHAALPIVGRPLARTQASGARQDHSAHGRCCIYNKSAAVRRLRAPDGGGESASLGCHGLAKRGRAWRHWLRWGSRCGVGCKRTGLPGRKRVSDNSSALSARRAAYSSPGRGGPQAPSPGVAVPEMGSPAPGRHRDGGPCAAPVRGSRPFSRRTPRTWPLLLCEVAFAT